MQFNFSQSLRVLTSLLLSTLLAVSVQAAEATSGLIAKGDKQWGAGNLDGAQATFAQAVKAEPLSIEVQFKLGGVQLSRNDFAAAIQTYQQIIGIDAKNVRAWLGLGISYMHTGEKELSRAAFEEVVRLEPQRKEALSAVLTKLSQAD